MVTNITRQNAAAGRVFKAIADPTRRVILDRLQQGAMSAGDVAAHFAVSRPAISRHLRVLRSANLVIETRRGRHRLYELNAQPLQAVDGWIDRYRTHWTARLMDLKNYVESQSQARAAQPPAQEQPGAES